MTRKAYRGKAYRLGGTDTYTTVDAKPDNKPTAANTLSSTMDGENITSGKKFSSVKSLFDFIFDTLFQKHGGPYKHDDEYSDDEQRALEELNKELENVIQNIVEQDTKLELIDTEKGMTSNDNAGKFDILVYYGHLTNHLKTLVNHYSNVSFQDQIFSELQELNTLPGPTEKTRNVFSSIDEMFSFIFNSILSKHKKYFGIDIDKEFPKQADTLVKLSNQQIAVEGLSGLELVEKHVTNFVEHNSDSNDPLIWYLIMNLEIQIPLIRTLSSSIEKAIGHISSIANESTFYLFQRKSHIGTTIWDTFQTNLKYDHSQKRIINRGVELFDILKQKKYIPDYLDDLKKALEGVDPAGGAVVRNRAKNMGIPLTVSKPASTGGGRRSKTTSELQRDIKKKVESREKAKDKKKASATKTKTVAVTVTKTKGAPKTSRTSKTK